MRVNTQNSYETAESRPYLFFFYETEQAGETA